MNKFLLSFPVFLLLACNECAANAGKLTLEQRIALLEKRLEVTEKRAENAEVKLKNFKMQQAAEMSQIKEGQG